MHTHKHVCVCICIQHVYYGTLYNVLYMYMFVYIYICMLNHFSCVLLFVITLQIVAYQAPPSMGFSRQEY